MHLSFKRFVVSVRFATNAWQVANIAIVFSRHDRRVKSRSILRGVGTGINHSLAPPHCFGKRALTAQVHTGGRKRVNTRRPWPWTNDRCSRAPAINTSHNSQANDHENCEDYGRFHTTLPYT